MDSDVKLLTLCILAGRGREDVALQLYDDGFNAEDRAAVMSWAWSTGSPALILAQRAVSRIEGQ
jgi:hypothetical protein